jgi:hypothetical protein
MNHAQQRQALLIEASRYRDRAARGASYFFGARWDCGRGHEWDDALSRTENVRCMSCASQRRELETKRLRELAQVRGGELVSESFVDAATPVRWQCAHGHQWDAHAGDAQRRWCSECARIIYAAYR